MSDAGLECLEKRWIQYTSEIRELHKKISEMEKRIDELGHKAYEVLGRLSATKPDHPVVQYYNACMHACSDKRR